MSGATNPFRYLSESFGIDILRGISTSMISSGILQELPSFCFGALCQSACKAIDEPAVSTDLQASSLLSRQDSADLQDLDSRIFAAQKQVFSKVIQSIINGFAFEDMAKEKELFIWFRISELALFLRNLSTIIFRKSRN